MPTLLSTSTGSGSTGSGTFAALAGLGWPAVVLGIAVILLLGWAILDAGRTSRLAALIRAFRRR